MIEAVYVIQKKGDKELVIKISVIIPIYNAGDYLDECLKSVLNQTLKEIEVICINDGSTDNSLEILHKYALVYSNISVVSQENRGAAKSRNHGLEVAKGEFVAFMDSDDYYPEHDILEHLYEHAKANHVLICGGSLSIFSGDRVRVNYDGWRKSYTFADDKIMKYQDYQFHYGFTRFIYNLNFLRKNYLRFPSYTYYEDPPFFVRALICAAEFYALKKITYCYRDGHKRVVLTKQNAIDYATGTLDILSLSQEKKFNKLCSILIELMYKHFSPAIYRLVAKGNLELQQLLVEIKNVIDLNQTPDQDYRSGKFPLLGPEEFLEFISRMKERKIRFLQHLNQYKATIIYGAGIIGIQVSEYLKTIQGIEIISFAVSEMTENPNYIDGVPVRLIDELASQSEKALVLIATSIRYHKEIQSTLDQLNFKNILPIYSDDFQYFLNEG